MSPLDLFTRTHRRAILLYLGLAGCAESLELDRLEFADDVPADGGGGDASARTAGGEQNGSGAGEGNDPSGGQFGEGGENGGSEGIAGGRGGKGSGEEPEGGAHSGMGGDSGTEADAGGGLGGAGDGAGGAGAGNCESPCPPYPVPVGDPSFHLDPEHRNRWLFRGADGHVHMLGGAEPRQWQTITAGVTDFVPAATDPLGYARHDGYHAVVYRADDGDIVELYDDLGSWWSADLSGLAVARSASGRPFPYVRSDYFSAVVYRNENNRIAELYLDLQYWPYWFYAEMPMPLGGPAAAGDPRPFIRADHKNAMVYRDVNGGLHEIYLDGDWTHADMGSAGAAGDGAPYQRSDLRNAVVYRAFDGSVHELSSEASSHSWSLEALGGLGDPIAATDPTGHVRSDGVDIVVHTSADGHVHELRRAGNQWTAYDLTVQTGAPDAAGAASPYRTADGHSAIAFRGRDDKLHELTFSEVGWAWRVLFPPP